MAYALPAPDTRPFAGPVLSRILPSAGQTLAGHESPSQSDPLSGRQPVTVWSRRLLPAARLFPAEFHCLHGSSRSLGDHRHPYGEGTPKTLHNGGKGQRQPLDVAITLRRVARTPWLDNAGPAIGHNETPSPRTLRSQWDRGCV